MTDSPEGTSLPGLDTLFGVVVVEMTGARVELKLPVVEKLHQPYGILHGGVHCSLVESAASMGAAAWFGDRGTVVGVSNHTDFLKAISEGVLTAVAEPIHQGRLQQLWLVNIRDERDRLIARGQVRIQNLAASPPMA